MALTFTEKSNRVNKIMAEIIKKLTCVSCKHEWFPKTPKKPICCPNCKTAAWETGKGPRSIEAKKRKLKLVKV